MRKIARMAVDEAAGSAVEEERPMEYEIVTDYDQVEHVVLRSGGAWEHEPVCDGIAGVMLFDGDPEPEMCEDCKRWLALNGDPALLAAAVAGVRACWLACLPGASPAAAEVLASIEDTP